MKWDQTVEDDRPQTAVSQDIRQSLCIRQRSVNLPWRTQNSSLKSRGPYSTPDYSFKNSFQTSFWDLNRKDKGVEVMTTVITVLFDDHSTFCIHCYTNNRLRTGKSFPKNHRHVMESIHPSTPFLPRSQVWVGPKLHKRRTRTSPVKFDLNSRHENVLINYKPQVPDSHPKSFGGSCSRPLRLPTIDVKRRPKSQCGLGTVKSVLPVWGHS